MVEVKATKGDTFLGGDNFDQRVIEWIVEEFKREDGVDLAKDRMALQRLREAAEKAKMELSSVAETEINLPFITADQSGPAPLAKKLSRARFEQLVEDWCIAASGRRAGAADAGVSATQIEEVVLVGGSTRVPRVHAMSRTCSAGAVQGRQRRRGRRDRRGSAGRRARRRREGLLLLDVTPLSLGIEMLGGVITKPTPGTPPSRQRKARRSRRRPTASQRRVHVLQGERPLARDNRRLGQFHLDGIPPARAACRRSR